MEKFNNYSVVVSIEVIDGVDTPIIDTITLEENDVKVNYEWVDEDKTILKKKDFIL